MDSIGELGANVIFEYSRSTLAGSSTRCTKGPAVLALDDFAIKIQILASRPVPAKLTSVFLETHRIVLRSLVTSHSLVKNLGQVLR